MYVHVSSIYCMNSGFTNKCPPCELEDGRGGMPRDGLKGWYY